MSSPTGELVLMARVAMHTRKYAHVTTKNAKKVHAANRAGQPLCGAKLTGILYTNESVNCAGCMLKSVAWVHEWDATEWPDESRRRRRRAVLVEAEDPAS